MRADWHSDCIVGGTSNGAARSGAEHRREKAMRETTGARADSVEQGMAVFGADGQPLGNVERIEGGGFVVAGQRIANDAIQRVEAGHVHLFGNGATYAGARTADDKAQRSARLPNTDAPLYVNERDVEASLEERLPRDGQR
jgi:hypothetical protein